MIFSYTDLHAQYLLEQFGGNGAPCDPDFGVKQVYEHYRQCDQYDDIFVMDETIQALTGGAKTERVGLCRLRGRLLCLSVRRSNYCNPNSSFPVYR